MTFWTADHFCETLAGRWISAPTAHGLPLRGVSIDSRTVAPGDAFIALPGERFDGHDFLQAAADAGAAVLVVERPTAHTLLAQPRPILQVPSTRKALRRLALDYRDRLRATGTRIISVSGSNGKTTTRHLIHTILSTTLTGTQSPKSFNNDIGVPLTLLGAKLGDDFAVVEIGTNHPGEVDALASLVRPDIAVVTALGYEHLEFFGDLDGVAREEAAILPHIQPRGALVSFAPGALLPEGALDASLLTALPPGIANLRIGDNAGDRYTVEPLPSTSADPLVQGMRLHDRARGETLAVHLRLPGTHNLLNAAAALAVAWHLELPRAAMVEGILAAEPREGRMQPIAVEIPEIANAPAAHRAGAHRILVLHDAYNSNLSSARAAADTLAAMAGGRRILILGDMLELGAQTETMHRMLGEHVAGHMSRGAIDRLLLIGPACAAHAGIAVTRTLGPAGSFEAIRTSRVTIVPQWRDDLPAALAATLLPGDVVLLKASRGMTLERLIPAIQRRAETTSPSRRQTAADPQPVVTTR